MKLQHASFGLPGGKGLFSPIWKAMQTTPKLIIITPELKYTLRDWRTIIQQMAHSPSSIRLLVPNTPHLIQYTDACLLGCGGVLSPGADFIPYTAWQFQWPSTVTKLVKAKKLSINDLELAGMVMGWLVLEAVHEKLAYKHVGTFCDNTTATSWAHKGHTNKSIPAARLLRFLSLRQRTRQTSSILPLYIQGIDNVMADVLSRAFKQGAYFHAQANLVSYFNSHYPLPQNKSWTEFTVPKKLSWRVISCLRGELLPMESLIRLPKRSKNIGNTGAPTQQLANPTQSSRESLPYTKPSSSPVSLQGSGQVLSETALKSKFNPLVKLSRPSQRPWNWLDNRVPPTKRRVNSLPLSSNAWRDSEGKMHLQSHN